MALQERVSGPEAGKPSSFLAVLKDFHVVVDLHGLDIEIVFAMDSTSLDWNGTPFNSFPERRCPGRSSVAPLRAHTEVK